MANSSVPQGIHLRKGSGRTEVVRVVSTEAQAVALEFDGYTRLSAEELAAAAPKAPKAGTAQSV